jgi:hypothetical protein
VKLAILCLLALAGSARAQATGSITGTVTDSTSRLPIHRALVAAAGGSRDVTASDGTFSLQDLPVGEVKLRIAIAGYRALDTSVKISDGDRLTCYFELHPMARITGKVVDKATGEPVAREVALFDRERTLDSLALSDKNGAFEINSLEPGDYTLALDPITGEALISSDPSDMARRQAYGTAAWPETIHLAEGEQRFIDMSVSSVESHSVSGSLEFLPGYEDAPVSIGYGSVDGTVSSMQSLGKGTRGQFRIDGLVPGAYSVNAVAGEGPARVYGSVPVSIKDQDIDGLVIKLTPGINITGAIRLAEDGASLPPKTPDLAVALLPVNRLPMIISPMFVVGGRFHSEGVAQGEYWPQIMGLPDGYAVTSVLFGNAGTTGRPISLYGPGELTFVVTSKPGGIVGTVRDHNQVAVKDAEVLLIPDASADQPYPQTGRSLSGDSGEFRFRNVPPGNYTIEGAPAFKVQPGETVNITVLR